MNCTPKVRHKTLGVQFFMRHSFEEKLNIVSKVKIGQPIESLGRMLGICPKDIRMWLRRYDKYGESGLNRKKNASLSGSEKEIRVREYLEKGLSLPSISNTYDISVKTLKSWVKKVQSQGYTALYEPDGRGRATNSMARPKKKAVLTELEKLQAENLRLRAENALLKKVKALVEEEEARARLNGQKSLTN